MKYVKPMVEVINIENEDIIVASGCMGGPGSARCISRGRTDEANSMSAMGCSTSGSWRYECLNSGNTGVGSSCSGGTINGITCSVFTAGAGMGIGGGLVTCGQAAGAN